MYTTIGFITAGFRFAFGSDSTGTWFLIALTAGALLVCVPALYQARALRLLRQQNSAQAIEKRLDELDLGPGEELVFQNIVHVSGFSVSRCIQSVEAFDRGVDEFLEQSSRLPSIQRVDLLRTIRAIRRKLGYDQAAPNQILKSTRALQLGQALTIALPRAKREESILSGAISQLDDEGISIRLDSKHRNGIAQIRARSGKELEIHFFRPDDSAYYFRSPIVETRDKRPGVVRVSHPKRLVRQQRRNFLRVDTDEMVSIRWFPGSLACKQIGVQGDLKHVMEVHRGRLMNISGGGIQLKVERLEIQLDDWIEVHFPFLPPPLDRESCLARVVQVYERPPAGVFGLRFEKPSVRLQTAILRDVERRAREMRLRAQVDEEPAVAAQA